MTAENSEAEYQAIRGFLKFARADSSSPSAIAIREKITERQRTVLEMRYIRQMLMVDIARELGVNISTVSRTLARGRKRLAAIQEMEGAHDSDS